VRGTFTGNPERYVKKALETGISIGTTLVNLVGGGVFERGL